MKDYQDAYGHLMYDYFKDKRGFEIVERDDGFFDASGPGPQSYLSRYRDWSPHQRRAMRFVKGRVLDIGCGAGRHSLYLQEKGFDVLGIDISPLAVQVCRLRGLKKARVMSVTQISSKLGTFDTLLMLGNNFGLLGNQRRAKWLFKRFHLITKGTARIIAEARNPYQTTNSLHREYHELNRKRGRMPGQLRIRIRYEKYVTPWFEFLLLSKDEMRQLAIGNGWDIVHFVDSEGPMYVAMIERIAI